jgi:DNA-binding response OmpR family regulator
METRSLNTRTTVLIVEDEPFVRLFGADLLEQAGFDVLQARDAAKRCACLKPIRRYAPSFPIFKCRAPSMAWGSPGIFASAGRKLESF